MKFFTLAALLATVAAVNLRDDADVTDLFNDNSDEIETQKIENWTIELVTDTKVAIPMLERELGKMN